MFTLLYFYIISSLEKKLKIEFFPPLCDTDLVCAEKMSFSKTCQFYFLFYLSIFLSLDFIPNLGVYTHTHTHRYICIFWYYWWTLNRIFVVSITTHSFFLEKSTKTFHEYLSCGSFIPNYRRVVNNYDTIYIYIRFTHLIPWKFVWDIWVSWSFYKTTIIRQITKWNESKIEKYSQKPLGFCRDLYVCLWVCVHAYVCLCGL